MTTTTTSRPLVNMQDLAREADEKVARSLERFELRQQEREQKKAAEPAEPYPKGEGCPSQGWDPYVNGQMELIAEVGLLQPMGRNLLLKAVEYGAESSIFTLQQHAQNALCYEIVAKGEDVPEAYKVGNHCLHVSASADPVDVKNEHASFLFVEHLDIAGQWDPVRVRRVFNARPTETLQDIKDICVKLGD